MINWIKKYVAPWLPLYYMLPLAAALMINNIIYMGTQWLCGDLYHWNMELEVDHLIKVMPGFVSIYFFFFAFSGINYILFGHMGRERAYQLLLTDVICKVICGLCFVLIPTTNVRPTDLGSGFWSDALRFIYWIDQPVNLFPSIHCLVSWICFIGIRSSKRFPVWYKLLTGVMAGMICFSTLATKQHVIVDMIAAIFLAETVHFLVIRRNWSGKLGRWIELGSNHIFGKENVKESWERYEK
ncbi:MAG: phosphatidic acid phosphatase [Clostridia bacterium]|nr:phosphatidic acid phosphatase [Clostridia bacterium]NCC42576.1 phosphatidic acid phosphatase [Clostridia bacterium]